MSFIVDSALDIGKNIVGSITDHFKAKRELKQAKVTAEIEMLKSAQLHDQAWELESIKNNGWKDDILFYTVLGLFVWTGFFPEQATEFYKNLALVPEWLIKTWFWLVASVLGVKKIGEYGSKAIKEIRNNLKR